METKDRTGYIGGSDIAAILGISPWRTVLGLWVDKVHPDLKKETQVQTRGKRLEPYILDMVQEEYGVIAFARNKRYQDQEVPYFACEIDAERLEPTENIEIKTVHPYKLREWGEQDTDELPLHYNAQVQWGLGITRRDVCRVFALIGDDLRSYVVERDDVTIKAMRERATEFWQTYVVPKVSPPIDWEDERVLDYLKRIYPGTDGTTLMSSKSDEHWRHVYEEARSQADKYENVASGAKAHLLSCMREAALLKFEDGKALRRKLIKVSGYTVADREQMDVRYINAKDPK